MPVLHLGVADLPYSEAPQTSKRSKPKAATMSNETTGDVAEILENKYHIMEHFYQEHKSDIALFMEGSLAGALENLLAGGPSTMPPLGEASSAIEDKFKAFLSNREMDALGFPGIPTKASIMGISHRFKGKHGPSRPSFIDTGLYESSFKSWVD